MPVSVKPPTATASSRPRIPEDALEQELDEALEATFPASDPIAVNPGLLDEAPGPAGRGAASRKK